MSHISADHAGSAPASDSIALGAAIRARACELGFDLVGFGPAAAFAEERELILADLARGHLDGMSWITADRVRLSCDPQTLLPGATSIVALGIAYGQPPSTESERLVGRVAMYAWGRDYHKVIPPRLKALAETIVATAGSDTRCRAFVDTGPLVDRAAATRGGLGFVGKNTCVLTGRFGSYVFLSAILTTATIDPDPVSARDCGSCRACLDACPTEAFVGPRQLDATRCISYLTIEHRGAIPIDLRSKMGDWVFGCDVCQQVCPWNRARPRTPLADFAPERGAGEALDLRELLTLDDAAFRNRFAGTALMRAKRAGLLRNAAIALGNSGDQAAIPALVAALADGEPLVRGHAAWALGQLAPLSANDRAAIAAARDSESDARARDEMTAALGRVDAATHGG